MSNRRDSLASHLDTLTKEVEGLSSMPESQRIPAQWKNVRAALGDLFFTYTDTGIAPLEDRMDGPFFEKTRSALQTALTLLPHTEEMDIVRESLQRLTDLFSSETLEEAMQKLQQA